MPLNASILITCTIRQEQYEVTLKNPKKITWFFIKGIPKILQILSVQPETTTFPLNVTYIQ